jgi:hypothetical protein
MPGMSTTARPAHRTLTIVLVVLGLVLLGVVAVGVLGYCSVLGCTFLSEDFEPQGEQATAARATATAGTADLAGRFVAGREVIADATADGCTTGQNNWKVKDTYSHECSVVDSRVVLVTTDREAVDDGLTAADAALRDLGCAPASPRGGLDRVLSEYWHERNPQVERYGAAGLPGAVYQCTDERVVEVEPTSNREPSSQPEIALASAFFDDDISRHWYTDADTAALDRSDAELALVVTVREHYYDTRF